MKGLLPDLKKGDIVSRQFQ